MNILHSRSQFSTGQLLRRAALVSMESQCFELPNLLFSSYGDGILSGCELSTTSDTISMSTGVISFNGTLYGLHEPTSLKYSPTDRVCYLKLYIGSEEIVDSCIMRRISLKLAEEETSRSGEFELCRFRLQHGAYLRSQYTSFEDMHTIFDTLNMVNAKYSALGGSSLSGKITKAYAREIISFPSLPELDAMIALQWLQEPYAISEDVIRHYLSRHHCIAGENVSNEILFKGLVDRMNQLRTGINAPVQNQRTDTGRRKMIID